MNSILEIGIVIIQFFQGVGDWIIPIMKSFTFLGDEQFYLLAAPVLYWCIDSSIGFRTAIMLMVSSSIYNYGKLLIHSPRPSWYSTAVKTYRIETTFGAPSGHTTNAVTIWGIIGDGFRKKWLWVIAVVLMVLIGLSRVILAVHFPHDVLLGWVFGILILILFIRLEPAVVRWFQPKSTQYKIGSYFVISIIMILVGLLVLLPLRNWSVPVEWTENSMLVNPDREPINPTSLSPQITVAGTFFGLCAGYTLLFSRAGFSTRGSWWILFLRYFTGVVGVFLIWYGLDMVFPDGDTAIAYMFRYLRYGLVGFWITFLGPKLFIALKLAGTSQDQAAKTA
jgi:membrane-associated phospholipid phosphatase